MQPDLSGTDRPRDALTGTRVLPSGFEHFDMTRRLRMRAFIGLCMPAIFERLQADLGLLSLRNRGYAPISFYLNFLSGATPIAFGSDFRLSQTIKLYRSVPEPHERASENGGRLMFVSHIGIEAEAHHPGPDAFGSEAGTGARIEAGSAGVMHVLTRPAAAAGEHRVEAMPDELSVLKEHRWDRPLPSLGNLDIAPEGYERIDVGSWSERLDVWGLPNTDVNQHVNVQEYVMGAENHFTRLLHGAGLAVATHRIARARLLLRKPFFPGQVYAIRGELYRKEKRTRMQAGFYLVEGRQPAARASSFVVFDGEPVDADG